MKHKCGCLTYTPPQVAGWAAVDFKMECDEAHYDHIYAKHVVKYTFMTNGARYLYTTGSLNPPYAHMTANSLSDIQTMLNTGGVIRESRMDALHALKLLADDPDIPDNVKVGVGRFFFT